MERTLSRKQFLRFTGLTTAIAILAACGDPTSTPTPVLAPTQDLGGTPAPEVDINEVMDRLIRTEVDRIVKEFAGQDPLVDALFLGSEQRPGELNTVFPHPIPTGWSGEKGPIAAVKLGNPTFSEQPILQLNTPSSSQEMKKVERIDTSIRLSAGWQHMESDEVKYTFLRKEAYTLLNWDYFAYVAGVNAVIGDNSVQQLDSNASGSDMQSALWYALQQDDRNMRTLFDYSGVLPVLGSAADIMISGTEVEKFELGKSNLPKLVELSRAAGIDVHGIQYGTEEYLNLVITANSPWTRLVLDPANKLPQHGDQ